MRGYADGVIINGTSAPAPIVNTSRKPGGPKVMSYQMIVYLF